MTSELGEVRHVVEVTLLILVYLQVFSSLIQVFQYKFV